MLYSKTLCSKKLAQDFDSRVISFESTQYNLLFYSLFRFLLPLLLLLLHGIGNRDGWRTEGVSQKGSGGRFYRRTG